MGSEETESVSSGDFYDRIRNKKGFKGLENGRFNMEGLKIRMMKTGEKEINP